MITAFHRGRGLIAWLIRWQTRSPYSHVSIILPDGTVVESREPESLWGIVKLMLTGKGGGVRRLAGIQHAIKPGEYADLFFPPPMDDSTTAALADWYLSQVGKPYDIWMVLRFLSRRQETRASTGKWFCSEFWFAGFLRFGIRLLALTEPWEVSPGGGARSPLLRPHRRIVRHRDGTLNCIPIP